MLPTTRLEMTDLSRQKRFTADLAMDLTPGNSVDQAVQLFLERLGIADHGLRWTAFSRGVRLDQKLLLEELPDADARWTVMPEVSAG